MSQQELEGQVAVVTGATSGIGKAIAQQLARAGVRLVVTGRQAEKLEEVASQTKAESIVADITDAALPDRLLQRASERFGRCDILINNAGRILTGSIAEIDIDEVCSMVRVNVEATYRAAHVFARHFASQRYGHLINISSILGTKVRPTAGAYAGTKYAIEALSEALRMELAGSGVQICCIEPGLVRTELHRDWEVHPTKLLNIPNPLLPDDIAQCVLFALTRPEHVRIPRLMVLPGEHEI